jgi:hypothetical protein
MENQRKNYFFFVFLNDGVVLGDVLFFATKPFPEGCLEE